MKGSECINGCDLMVRKNKISNNNQRNEILVLIKTDQIMWTDITYYDNVGSTILEHITIDGFYHNTFLVIFKPRALFMSIKREQ